MTTFAESILTNMNLVFKYFFRGLLYTVPVAIILYVILQIFFLIGTLFHNLGLQVHPLIDPIIGLFALFFFIILFGILGSTLLFKPFFQGIEGLIEKAPLIKTIYFSIKDMIAAFVGTKKRFNQPVLVKMSKNDDLERLGFVTQSDLTKIGITKDKVAVYLPFSYTISGSLYIVPRESITLINASSTDIMKFIVSGGVTDIEKDY